MNPPPQRLEYVGCRHLRCEVSLNLRSPTLPNFEASCRPGIKSLTISLYSCSAPTIVSNTKAHTP